MPALEGAAAENFGLWLSDLGLFLASTATAHEAAVAIDGIDLDWGSHALPESGDDDGFAGDRIHPARLLADLLSSVG